MELGERFCVATLLQKTSRVIILDCKFGEREYSGIDTLEHLCTRYSYRNREEEEEERSRRMIEKI
jgi:hypothetical protein